MGTPVARSGRTSAPLTSATGAHSVAERSGPGDASRRHRGP